MLPACRALPRRAERRATFPGIELASGRRNSVTAIPGEIGMDDAGAARGGILFAGGGGAVPSAPAAAA